MLLRWQRLGVAALLVLPFVISAGLGFLWLYERGLLLWFVMASTVLALTVWGTRAAMALVARRALRARLARQHAGPDAADVAAGATDAAGAAPAARRGRPTPPPPDADWTAPERAAYAAACDAIEARLDKPLPWEAIPDAALEVVERVASHLSNGRRGALDFTLPEALLLTERVAQRYRAFLRSTVPFSDQLSVRSLWWMWQRQDQARVAWQAGYAAYRGLRIALNPPVGVLREIERAATAGLQDRLGSALVRDAQAMLLEEVAQTAVNLYSGRLRFSDAELLAIELGTEARDNALQAQADAPVRIVLVGQLSAGKSSLVNALLGADAAETDAAPSTDRPASHLVEIDGLPCRLIDTPGLDGSPDSQARLLDEMLDADIVLWTLRANRPARAPDHALRAAFDVEMARQPARRRPPVIVVATGADLLMPDWPFAENRLPEAGQRRLGAAMAALGADLGGMVPIPVCSLEPSWNIDTVQGALAAALPEALMTQRNRRRLEARGKEGSLDLGANLQRAGLGLRAGARLLSRRILGARSR